MKPRNPKLKEKSPGAIARRFGISNTIPNPIEAFINNISSDGNNTMNADFDYDEISRLIDKFDNSDHPQAKASQQLLITTRTFGSFAMGPSKFPDVIYPAEKIQSELDKIHDALHSARTQCESQKNDTAAYKAFNDTINYCEQYMNTMIRSEQQINDYIKSHPLKNKNSC